MRGSVTAKEIGATFTFPSGRTTLVTGLFGVTDEVHTAAHTGVDLGLWDGTPVENLRGGGVIFTAPEASPWGAVFGNSLIVDHGDGTRALYAHLQRVDVAVGDRVECGDILGLSGHTGYYAGRQVDPHLHVGLTTDLNPWFNKDADGGVSRLLDLLDCLKGDGLGGPAAVVVAEPSAYDTAAHAADYLGQSNGRLRRMLEQRVPRFIIDEEVATGQRLQDALEACVATI